MKLNFTKMHGCGNDFIIFDNRKTILKNNNLPQFIKRICERKFNIGANGVMFVEKSKTADFTLRYFNADGSEGEMCGNGARCIARFAYVNGIAQKNMLFDTLDGKYKAKILEDGDVKIFFPPIDIKDFLFNQTLLLDREEVFYHFGSVGVPHTIVHEEKIFQISDENFTSWASRIRNHKNFPKGTNVNVVQIDNKHQISVRTYERGVEEETMACGSGATASAIISSVVHKTKSPVQVRTRGGDLMIDFTIDQDRIEHISLTGNAVIVYEGTINESF
ncbi:diaminopimelate epimerase [Pseudogracilibacillus sp. SO30301A]|uniref:diaminopimelate epimerase n=1 Tax=Pseudogracilibacillus sp. SO30301A TaxID=3098291 RepID=UPI00300E5CC6